MTTTLTSAQTEVLERIRPPRDERRSWPRHLRAELRSRIEDELASLVAELDEPLWVSKDALGGVSGCERRHVAERSTPFEWTPPMARGWIVHKSIELSIHRRGEPTPLDLVEDAIALLEGDDRGVGELLRRTGDPVRTELVAEATTLVGRFLEGFPPIGRAWRPSCESRRRVELCDDQLVLTGRFDLTLGLPDGDTSGRVVIDLKTGGLRPQHREELRYYALLEALVNGVPPARVANFYLDSGRVDFEDVDDGVLEASLRQIVGAGRRLVALRQGATPVERPGPACTWCPVQADCDTGTAFLAERDD